MKPFTVVIVALAILTGVGIYKYSNNQRQVRASDVQVSKRLKEHVTAAKNKGKDSVTIPTALMLDHAGSEDDVHMSLSYFNYVLAELIEQRSDLSAATNVDITTWCKFRILDTFSQSPKTLNIDIAPPQGMSPPNQDEFLIQMYGGSAVIDGVKVNVTDPSFPPFQLNKKYLLLVSLSPSRVGAFEGGPAGVFTADETGQITPLTRVHSRLAKSIQDNLGQSTFELRDKINLLKQL
jgi:hypothetical protein